MATMKPDKEIGRLKRQLETERSENTRLLERLRAKDNELDTAEARIVEFKNSESTAQSEILLAKQRIGVLESLASTSSEELLGTLTKLERENANLVGSLKHANDRIKTLVDERDPIRELRDMLKTQLTSMSQKFDALSGEHGKTKDERNRLSEKYKELLDDKRALEARVEIEISHNSIKDKLEEEKKGLERMNEDLQLRANESENLVLKIEAEKLEIQTRLDGLCQSRESLRGKPDYQTQEIDQLANIIIGQRGEETLTLKELVDDYNKVGLDLNDLKHKYERLKLKYKENLKVKDGPLRFKDPTSGQLMTNEQLFELNQKSVQDHENLKRTYDSLFAQHIERYNTLVKSYVEARVKADKAEKDLAKAVRRHCRAVCAMREEKNAEIQKKNDCIEVLTTGIQQIRTISLELGKGSPIGPGPI